jgi:uncharacterized lipoprotein YmbA
MKRIICLTTMALLMAGCGSSENFYRLSAEAPAATGHRDISLGVGPVTLPSYLDRAELVYQSGPNEFQVPTNARWTGSLRENISAVLATDLGRLLGAGEILVYPWTGGGAPHYAIAVSVQQFHAVSGVDAVLDLTWEIVNSRNGVASTRQSLSLREPIHGDGYGAVVAAESRLLARAAEQMAQSFRAE